MIPASRISRRNENVSAEVDGETVLMSIKNGNYYGMNPVGSRIWELIEKETTFGALCETLLKEFDATPAQIQTETSAFISHLMEEDLIQVS